MEGYRIMAESYRKLVKDGEMTEEEAASIIKTYDILGGKRHSNPNNLLNSGGSSDNILTFS
jgi:hypothetical protein